MGADALVDLSAADLRTIVDALTSGRLCPPYGRAQVTRLLGEGRSDAVSAALANLDRDGFSASQIATLVRLIEDKERRDEARQPAELVTSGPEPLGTANRSTAVVVRELFSHATTSVLLFGYAVYQGQQVFAALAERMTELPELKVELFLEVARPLGDDTAPDVIVARFVERFRSTQWPAGARLPEVYYDPRSLAPMSSVRSALHAKCVVVDSRHLLVSSANFTEAAQQRNIEIGLRLDDVRLARRVELLFGRLQQTGFATRAL